MSCRWYRGLNGWHGRGAGQGDGWPLTWEEKRNRPSVGYLLQTSPVHLLGKRSSWAENDQQTLISQILLIRKSDHYSAVLNLWSETVCASMAGGKRTTLSHHHKSIIYIWPLKMTGCRRQVCSSWSGIVTNSPGGESGVEDPCDEPRRVVDSARSTKTQPHSQTVVLKAPTVRFSSKSLLLIFPDDMQDDSALFIFD